ncbi:MAG: DUF2259 domain-containing protein [Spirochaetaceae bacterium]|nr:DUF2259 domain-containing protein [Spirochaetaceae bacterium]
MILKKLKKFFSLCVLLTVVLWNAEAGDTSTYVDLGFSGDGAVYMFGQYGIRGGTLRPWAELYAVNVARNNFIAGGRLSYTHNAPAESGQDGSGAFYRLLTTNTELAKQHGVNFLTRGRLLYVGLLDGIERETIDFRDFEREVDYRATIVTRTYGVAADLTSSFHIELEQTWPGRGRVTLRAGSPDVRRSRITTYQIRRVIMAPDDGALIFVVETRSPVSSGHDIRYMVEALSLDR